MGSMTLSSIIRRFGVVIAWIVIIIVFTILRSSTFFTVSNFTTILSSQAPLGILSLALLIPLAAGDYDLSVASVLTLASMVTAILNVGHGVPIVWSVIIAIVVGGIVGLANALICIGFGIDPFIVTLGMGTFIDGVTLWISNSTPLSGVSSGLTNIVVVFRVGDLSYEFYYFLVFAILIWYLFDYTPAGRRIQVVGKGREVARLSGLNVKRIRLLAFVAAGALSAVAGVVYLGTSGTADPSAGTSLLLPAFAAVFLGSTTIRPGRFNPWGTLVAVYFLTTGITGLSLLGVSSFVQQLFYGGALIISVALASLGDRSPLKKFQRRKSSSVEEMVSDHRLATDALGGVNEDSGQQLAEPD